MGRCQILLENGISIFKKLVSRRKHEVLQNFLVNGCSDVGFQKTQWTNTSRLHCTPNHHRLWKLNTGLQATWAMSFSTLPTDSRTLVSKWNTKLALIWKEDFGPLSNSPVLFLLSPAKTPLTTTVAKFLDTSVCGGSWCLDPSLSPFLVKFTEILESILLDNPHKAAVLSVSCASFSSTLFPSTQLFVNMWAKIITTKRTKDLNFFSLCALNLFNTRVSQMNTNKWTFSRHSNLFRCTCRCLNALSCCHVIGWLAICVTKQ